jgi:hypothetical protein
MWQDVLDMVPPARSALHSRVMSGFRHPIMRARKWNLETSSLCANEYVILVGAGLLRFRLVVSITDRSCPLQRHKRNIGPACHLHFTRHLINHILNRYGQHIVEVFRFLEIFAV